MTRHLQGLEETLLEHGRDFSMARFLESHLRNWPEEAGVRGEILHYDVEQSLLEEYTSVGFRQKKKTMLTRPVNRSFEGIPVYVAYAKAPVLVPEVKFDVRYRTAQEDDHTRSEMAVPLMVGKSLVGVLNLESDNPRTFTGAHLSYFERISPLLGHMLWNEIARSDAAFLFEALGAIARQTGKESILREFLERVVGFMGKYTLGCILVPAEKAGRENDLVVLANKGLAVAEGQFLNLKELGVIQAAAISSSKSCYWSAEEGGSRYPALADAIRAEYAKALVLDDRIIAMIDVASPAGAITTRSMSIIDRLAKESSAVIRALPENKKKDGAGPERAVGKSMLSVFISYGGPDSAFAVKLNEALISSGVNTFIFSRDAEPGVKLHRLMREGVNQYDRVLVVCSRDSLERPGVLNEIEESLQREAREGGVSVLIPVTLDDYVFSEWSPSRPDLAQSVRDRVIADFRSALLDEAKFRQGLRQVLACLAKPGMGVQAAP